MSEEHCCTCHILCSNTVKRESRAASAGAARPLDSAKRLASRPSARSPRPRWCVAQPWLRAWLRARTAPSRRLVPSRLAMAPSTVTCRPLERRATSTSAGAALEGLASRPCPIPSTSLVRRPAVAARVAASRIIARTAPSRRLGPNRFPSGQLKARAPGRARARHAHALRGGCGHP